MRQDLSISTGSVAGNAILATVAGGAAAVFHRGPPVFRLISLIVPREISFLQGLAMGATAFLVMNHAVSHFENQWRYSRIETGREKALFAATVATYSTAYILTRAATIYALGSQVGVFKSLFFDVSTLIYYAIFQLAFQRLDTDPHAIRSSDY